MWRAGARTERRWTLVASDGCGPEVPGLAVPVLLRRLRDRTLDAGARDAGPLLALTEFEPALSAMPVRRAVTEHALPPPLYARVMGAAFEALPPRVRAMHEVLRDHGASGCPPSPVAATLARIVRRGDRLSQGRRARPERDVQRTRQWRPGPGIFPAASSASRLAQRDSIW